MIRSDVFLHFLNRDTREIFGVQDFVAPDQTRVMRQALNAAVALCENHCIAPPGFLIEDSVAFELAETQAEYLGERLILLPMRENNFAEFAEKKRVGYYPMRDRYSGLFNDNRIDWLARNTPGRVRRKAHITEGILEGWQEGPDTRRRIWTPVKKLLTGGELTAISAIPKRLDESGTALTWSAIKPLLPQAGAVAEGPLRDALQNIYFGQYCEEFHAVVLSGVPFITHDFSLRSRRSYNFHRFQIFLDPFGLRNVVLNARAESLIGLRRNHGFMAFTDAYVGFADGAYSDTDVRFAASTISKAVKFDWTRLAQRRTDLVPLTDVEAVELGDALAEAAAALTVKYDLPVRGAGKETLAERKERPIIVQTAASELVIFVALDEELDILADQLGLQKSHLSPQATGKLGSVTVDVVCPKAMGRVPAAVAMTDFLARKEQSPKLVLIVGLAGGFAETGTQVSHTICVTEVTDLASRKVFDDQSATKFRRRDFNLNKALRDVLSSDVFDEKEWSADTHERFDWPKDQRPSIHFGPLASVDEVIASDEWRKLLLQGNDKLLGVEMEAGGVCAATDRMKLPCCMLRVVSDSADPSKADNEWRKRGMRGLANLLRRVNFERVFEAL